MPDNHLPTPNAPQDPTEPPVPASAHHGTETRLIHLGERWAKETTKLGVLVETVKASTEATASKSAELKEAIVQLGAAIAGLSTAVADLKTHCKKRTGIPAILDWAYEKAKESPQTFLMVAMVIITMMALAGAFGWNLSKHLGWPPKPSQEASQQDGPVSKAP